MLVLSPNQDLTSFDTTTTYVFRSEVPQGYTVVPRGKVMRTPMASSDMAMSVQDAGSATYEVPMLGIRQYAGKETTFRLKFDGELSGRGQSICKTGGRQVADPDDL